MRYLDLSYTHLECVNAAEYIYQLYNLQTLDLCNCKNVENILKEGIGSLINLRHLDLSSSDVNLLPDSITRLTNLQTLDISSCLEISVLPTNIGHLQNLSSFSISRTKISELPDSFSLLYNLTKFSFEYSNLETLPRNFGALTQLRSLDLYGSEITEFPESLTNNMCKLEFVNLGFKCKYPKDIQNWVELRHLQYGGEKVHVRMPRGIEKLTRLELLSPYIVREEYDVSIYSSTSSIHELADLNSLRSVRIESLENVRGGKTEADRAKLKDKQNIRYLRLEWNAKVEEEVDVNNSDMVLEGLQPHTNLEELFVFGFPGLKSPKWMGSSSCLPNLVELRIHECKSCTILAGLGQLPCLKIIKIEGMDSLKCFGKEFYYQQEVEESKGYVTPITTTSTTATQTLFPSLTRLTIRRLGNLEEWFAPENSFPCLEIVDISYCGNLTSIPDLWLWTYSLRSFCIWECRKLKKETVAYYFSKFLPSVQYCWSDKECYFNNSVEEKM